MTIITVPTLLSQTSVSRDLYAPNQDVFRLEAIMA